MCVFLSRSPLFIDYRIIYEKETDCTALESRFDRPHFHAHNINAEYSKKNIYFIETYANIYVIFW